MTDILAIDVLIVFIQWALPVVAVLSLVLLLRPKLFVDLEEKLSKEFIKKKTTRKTIVILERENLALQKALQKNNQIVGLLCFILTVFLLAKLY
jgi:hypothetical protein